MKVAARQADSFARNPDAAARAVLVYGPDAGLASERVQTLIAGALADPADPFRRVDLTGDTLEAHPAMLADEAAALNLTGGRRVVVVRGGGGSPCCCFCNSFGSAVRRCVHCGGSRQPRAAVDFAPGL